MPRKARNLADWEIALIKAMINHKGFKRDKIISYFTSPSRPVNGGRVTEIANGDLGKDVTDAKPFQLDEFLQNFHDKYRFYSFFESDPLHPVSIDQYLALDSQDNNYMKISENSEVEFKQSLNMKNGAEYSRVMVSFANSTGGYLVFGVRDNNREILGISPGRISNLDSTRFEQGLKDYFEPSIEWKKVEHVMNGKHVGIVYVWPNNNKPVVAKASTSRFNEGDILYRYPGYTDRIRYAELKEIIDEQVSNKQSKMADLTKKLYSKDPDNAAILDLNTGLVSGTSGNLFIDESLINKISFISQGAFTETGGEPTLRIVGDVYPASVDQRTIEFKEVPMSDNGIIKHFILQDPVDNPIACIQHIAMSKKIWIPIYYYIRKADMTIDDAISTLRDVKGAKKTHVDKLEERIRSQKLHSDAANIKNPPNTFYRLRDADLSLDEAIAAPKDFKKGVLSLREATMDVNYVLRMMKDLFHYHDEDPPAWLYVCAAHVDVVWEKQNQTKRDQQREERQ